MAFDSFAGTCTPATYETPQLRESQGEGRMYIFHLIWRPYSIDYAIRSFSSSPLSMMTALICQYCDQSLPQIWEREATAGGCRCPANMVHTRQSRPDLDLGVQVKVLKTLRIVRCWLGSGTRQASHCLTPLQGGVTALGFRGSGVESRVFGHRPGRPPGVSEKACGTPEVVAVHLGIVYEYYKSSNRSAKTKMDRSGVGD